MASEADPKKVLRQVSQLAKPKQLIFIGVIDPLDPAIELPQQVRDRVLQAAYFIPVQQLGTTDDCGFSPFADDVSTARDIAFAKIAARVKGTALAVEQLGF
jgi:5-methyltetrahydropteroyltriglutamate--homocysteine methyltransferase